MKNKLEFASELALQTRMCLEVPSAATGSTLHFGIFLCEVAGRISAVSSFYLAVRAHVTTVADSFIFWFLCEAEKER